MNCLHVTVPSVFVRVDNVETLACCTPSCKCIPELVDPPGTTQGRTYLVIGHATRLMTNLLRKYMNLMPLAQMLNQGNGIALSAATTAHKNPVEDSNA